MSLFFHQRATTATTTTNITATTANTTTTTDTAARTVEFFIKKNRKTPRHTISTHTKTRLLN